jgi:hypothetical protein
MSNERPPDLARVMVDWFRSNYADPENVSPRVDGAHIMTGKETFYLARHTLADAFDGDVIKRAIDEAVDELGGEHKTGCRTPARTRTLNGF